LSRPGHGIIYDPVVGTWRGAVVSAFLMACGAGNGRDEGPAADSDSDSDSDSDADAGADGRPECAADPLAPGCPCTGLPRECYDGPPQTLDVGVCHGGEKRCLATGWTRCGDEVLPTEEVWDRADDDCDGQVDEGLLEPGCIGVGCEDAFDPGVGDVGTREEDDGALSLEEGAPDGIWSRALELPCPGAGCPPWYEIAWLADVPEGASLTIEARGARDADSLDEATWVRIATVPPDESPAEIPDEGDGPAWGQVFEVRVHLSASPSGASPRLLKVWIPYSCSLVIC
jgi:hypothetical protein